MSPRDFLSFYEPSRKLLFFAAGFQLECASEDFYLRRIEQSVYFLRFREATEPPKVEPPPQATHPKGGPDAETIRELARLRAEIDRLKGLVANPPKSAPVSKPAEVAYGKVSGAAWTVKNDGTSNLMRGIPIIIVEKETTDVPKLIGHLKKVKNGWVALAKLCNEEAERKRNDPGNANLSDGGKYMRSLADKDADEADSCDAKAKAIQKRVDQLSGTTSIDRLRALELEKQDLESDKHTVDVLPEVLTGGGQNGTNFGSGKTNVDGKFVLDMVPPGDYYLVSCFASATLIIEWIVPIHVVGNKETTVDLDSDNAAFIKQEK